MHDVSLRSDVNRMDAHNLAIVLCPNLVASSNPARTVQMCALPAEATGFSQPSGIPVTSAEGPTTLGMVIKLCIQRYYEIFDEVLDRGEAPTSAVDTTQPLQRGSVSSEQLEPLSPTSSRRQRDSMYDEDDEIDDAMLVMPIGPSSSSGSGPSGPASPPSAWGVGIGSAAHRSRHRISSSGDSTSGVRSMHGGIGEHYWNAGRHTIGKARSMISIESSGRAGGSRTPGKKDTITVGRGATRKSSGAAVEAIGVTVAGFFSPPPMPNSSSSGHPPSG
jgi:Rho GTPase-activating protein 1